MRPVILLLIAYTLLAISLVSCENCGPTAEPLVRLSVRPANATRLDTIYAPGSLRPLPSQLSLTPVGSTSRQFIVPINLTADSTRYVVQFGGRRDTITVFYQRRTAYRNRRCGYVLDLYAPPKGPSARTTSGRIEHVSYVQNRDGNLVSGSQDTGIYLSVSL